MYLIESGMLRASYLFLDQSHSICESMVAGTTAGELTFLSRTKRNATVVAERDSVLWKLDVEAHEQMGRSEGWAFCRALEECLLRIAGEEQEVLMVSPCLVSLATWRVWADGIGYRVISFLVYRLRGKCMEGKVKRTCGSSNAVLVLLGLVVVGRTISRRKRTDSRGSESSTRLSSTPFVCSISMLPALSDVTLSSGSPSRSLATTTSLIASPVRRESQLSSQTSRPTLISDYRIPTSKATIPTYFGYTSTADEREGGTWTTWTTCESCM
jgi:hypothetical protein